VEAISETRLDGESLGTDCELLLRNVATEGREGPAWAQLSDSLARYAQRILVAWVRSGQMYDQCRRLGIRLAYRRFPLEDTDVHSLVNLTIAQGLRRFHERSVSQGRWHADGGSSLKSWFVNDCLIEYPNIWRSWVKTELRWLWADNACSKIDMSVTEPHLMVDEHLEVVDAITSIDDNPTRIIVALLVDDYPLSEIAEFLGLSSRAVEGRLYRWRLKQREQLRHSWLRRVTTCSMLASNGTLSRLKQPCTDTVRIGLATSRVQPKKSS
jgi:DNA-directed RNA polymerase specialized sigma24 family protein